MWRWLRLAGCDGAAADDVCQEVFLVAVDRLSDWSSAGAVRQWLLAAARNKLLHHRRAFARCGLVVDVEAADQIYADRWSDESDGPVRALRHCLGELTPRAREAIEARVTDRVGRADLARRLGMKVGGVKTLLGRTRAALRACIERRMAGEESNDA